ncbi:MAG: DUF2299 family protein [Candidatus Hodarchaeales archaeon]|jgi:hypothetical protein
MSTDEFKDLEYKIRDILDRNGFASQKIDPRKMKVPPDVKKTPQDAFRIRVSQPLRFQVEIVKPIQLKDFLFIAGRLNVSQAHQQAIARIELDQRLDLLDSIRLELGRLKPTSKFNFDKSQNLVGIECMTPIIISEENLVKDLFTAMDAINKSFFTIIFMLQRQLRKAGIAPVGPESRDTTSPFYQ